MIVEESGLDVLKEHGFNVSTLVIIAIIDLTTSPLDNIPAARASVEIFALENLYDPLVANGSTNENGHFSVLLNGDKDYVIVVKSLYEGLPVIGVAKVYLPPNSHITVEIRLSAYH